MTEKIKINGLRMTKVDDTEYTLDDYPRWSMRLVLGTHYAMTMDDGFLFMRGYKSMENSVGEFKRMVKNIVEQIENERKCTP